MNALSQLSAQHQLMLVLLALQFVDVATGWLCAYVRGVVSSSANWRGVSRKLLTVSVLIVIALVSSVAPSPLDGFPLLTPALIGYIAGECYSILENVQKAGITLPAPLDKAFRNREDLPG